MTREEELLALIRWAYEITEEALFLRGRESRDALVKASADINQKFKAYVK